METYEHVKDILSDNSYFDGEPVTSITSIERKILQDMDRAFDSIGKNITVVFYKALQNDRHMNRESIFFRPDDFIEFLRNFFGPGSILIERTIAREIMSEIKLPGASVNSIKTALEIVKRHPSTS